MRTVHTTRDDRHVNFASPLVRAIGASAETLDAKFAAMNEIAVPALMGGVWALPAPAPKPVRYLVHFYEFEEGSDDPRAIQGGGGDRMTLVKIGRMTERRARAYMAAYLERYGDKLFPRWYRG